MLHIEDNSAIKVLRTHDISDWQDITLDIYNSKIRKRIYRRKAAIISYFTTNRALAEIAAEYHMPPKLIEKLASRCLRQHEDGQFWGFRALLPGAAVVDHIPADTNGSHPTISTNEEEEEVEPTTKLPVPRDASRSRITTPLTGPANEENITTTTEQAAHEDSTPEAEPESATDDSTSADAAPSDEPAIALQHGPGETVQAATTTDPDATSTTDKLPAKLPEPDQLAIQPATGTMADDCLQHLPLHRMLKRHDLRGLHAIARQRRMIRRRITRSAHEKKTSASRFRRAVSLTIIVTLLFAILIPLGVGLQVYNLYNSVNGIAHDGVDNLMEVEGLLSAAKSDPMSALDANKLQHAKTSFKDAENDFLQLQQLVDRPDVQSLANQVSPQYGKQLVAAQHLVQVALDVSRMGQELTDIGLIGSNALHGSPLATGAKAQPLLSIDNAAQISGALPHTLFYLDDIQLHMSQVQLQDLPLSQQQKNQLTAMLGQMPQIHDMLVQAQSLLPSVFWLLGVGHPRNFLVQTMDRGELRPSGGFTGQFGLLTIADGRVAPFTLKDVLTIDYGGNDVAIGRSAPSEYKSWMNFGNWGLRDSNLSPDYPTTAKLNMRVFQEEGGGPVDGVIAFTPTFISHILKVTGPIKVGNGYNETITAQNLEERLHFYQQDSSAINKQRQISGDTSNQARKEFTSLVGKLLMDKVRSLPTKKLTDIFKNATKDLESHDLQVYFTDPTAEKWLVDHGYNGAIDPFTKHDGFVVNQANISISKASTMVHTTEHDDIVLDSQGGAQHNLTITLDYKQTGNVYGFNTYADYLRIYAPARSQFQFGNGFDSGTALCKPAMTPPPNNSGDKRIKPDPGDNPPKQDDHSCAQYKTSFPSDARYCPDGNYDLGERYFKTPWPIDSLGGPTNKSSDLPGRAMWGGLTVTPKNCISTITLSWYVPNVVKHDSKGHPIYQILVQKQGGYSPTIELNVDASAVKGGKSFQVKKDIVKDTMFSMPH